MARKSVTAKLPAVHGLRPPTVKLSDHSTKKFLQKVMGKSVESGLVASLFIVVVSVRIFENNDGTEFRFLIF